MKISHKYSALLVAASSILAASSASAANSFYAPGDLVLYFQQKNGTNTVYANLGSATGFRGSAAGSADGTNRLNFLNLNLNSSLTLAFGDNWASDSTVYAGLAGVLNTTQATLAMVDGDPSRTAYVSQSRQNAGTVGQAGSSIETISGNTAMTTLAGGIFSQNNPFEVNYDSIVTVSLTGVSGIDDQNLFLGANQGAAFSTFGSGVQQQGAVGSFGTFGDAGDNIEFALDLYRILARGTGGTGTAATGTAPISGQVAGILREGSYEGTVTVNSSGLVSFVAIPEPSSTALLGLAAGALVLRRRRSA